LARERFEKALAALSTLRHGEFTAWSDDFRAARRSVRGPYLVSVRPLPRGRRTEAETEAVAIAFVRDTDRRLVNASHLPREVFGFTAAEAGVAQALQAGIPLGDYARKRNVSLNTVYTHLRRIKEKTGCNRLPELIRKLNDLQLPLRTD
jgi:DNA-binding CsgD family transcriptional regulator